MAAIFQMHELHTTVAEHVLKAFIKRICQNGFFEYALHLQTVTKS